MIKIYTAENCSQCFALKSYIKAALPDLVDKIQYEDANDFGFDKLAELGVRSLPALSNGEVFEGFTNLLNAAEFIKKNV